MVAVCCFAALFSSGAVGIPVTLFAVIAVVIAWNIEDSKWQLSERSGLVLIAMMILVFLIDLKFLILGTRSVGGIPIGSLGLLILFLCLIKLLQRKTERDWIFIYIISFFELLLSAGLSVSPLFLLYCFGFFGFITCAFVSLDIRRTITAIALARKSVNSDKIFTLGAASAAISLRTFSLIGFCLIVLITTLALPLFYIFPRDSVSGFGNPLARSAISGFSSSVRLGEIGTLKQSDEMVMRVKVESKALPESGLYWRGVTLDQFDNNRWRKSYSGTIEMPIRSSNNIFRVNVKSSQGDNIVQRFYLEPIGTSTVFALSKPLVLKGSLQTIRKSSDESMRSDKVGFQRTSYMVISDSSIPQVQTLRKDKGSYGDESSSFLQIPDNLDPRVSKLASDIDGKSGAENIYDRSKALETYLRTQYGYSLEMRATGDQPLSDFLFNIREGHCEYFATAMVMMLRTQGIASRIVNGFQQGDYNDSADIFVVRQRDAHSWVEVYFPETKNWITFDPTPSAGRYNEASTGSIWNRFGKYSEALEMIWIRYFLSYDSQEQSTLISSAKNRGAKYSESISLLIDALKTEFSNWWEKVRGDKGVQASAIAIGYGTAYLIAGFLGVLLLIWLFRKAIALSIWTTFANWLGRKDERVRIVAFYQRMQKVLAAKGVKRAPEQTPMEFALETGLDQAKLITQKYNSVRFGGKDLTKSETQEIEDSLASLAAYFREK